MKAEIENMKVEIEVEMIEPLQFEPPWMKELEKEIGRLDKIVQRFREENNDRK